MTAYRKRFGLPAQTHGRATRGPPPITLLSISSPSVSEGDAGTKTMTFVLTRVRDGGAPINFTYRTIDGTATAGVDYVATSGSSTIVSGGTVNLDVTINGDVTVEPDETLFMEIDNIRYA